MLRFRLDHFVRSCCVTLSVRIVIVWDSAASVIYDFLVSDICSYWGCIVLTTRLLITTSTCELSLFNGLSKVKLCLALPNVV